MVEPAAWHARPRFGAADPARAPDAGFVCREVGVICTPRQLVLVSPCEAMVVLVTPQTDDS